jgi:hypothetical protein
MSHIYDWPVVAKCQNGQYENYIATRYHLIDKKGEKAFSLLEVHFNLTLRFPFIHFAYSIEISLAAALPSGIGCTANNYYVIILQSVSHIYIRSQF